MTGDAAKPRGATSIELFKFLCNLCPIRRRWKAVFFIAAAAQAQRDAPTDAAIDIREAFQFRGAPSGALWVRGAWHRLSKPLLWRRRTARRIPAGSVRWGTVLGGEFCRAIELSLVYPAKAACEYTSRLECWELARRSGHPKGSREDTTTLQPGDKRTQRHQVRALLLRRSESARACGCPVAAARWQRNASPRATLCWLLSTLHCLLLLVNRVRVSPATRTKICQRRAPSFLLPLLHRAATRSWKTRRSRL